MLEIDEFIVTKEYKRFREFCNACYKEKYIGLCHGQAGVGKSMSAKHFSSWDVIDKDIQRSVPFRVGLEPSIDMRSHHTIIYTPEMINSPKSAKEDIGQLMHSFNRLKEKSLYKENIPIDVRLDNYVELIIIDEADRLQPATLEQIRAIYDKYSIALILIGMPGIEKRLVRFPQLYSRIGFAHTFKTLSNEEISFIIQHHCNLLGVEVKIGDFMDQEAIATISRITQGNFRLVNRLLKQAKRIMAVNQLSFISKEVVEAARECLVIGNIY